MKLLYYLFCIILLENSVYASHQRIAQCLGRLGRAFSIGLPVGAVVLKAGSTFHEYRKDLNRAPSPLPPLVTALCQEYVASCGKEFSKTPIIELGSSVTEVSLNGSIKIEKSVVDTLIARKIIQENPDIVEVWSKEQQDELLRAANQDILHFPFMLRHEVGHLYYGDNEPMKIAGSYLGGMALVQSAASILSNIRKARLPVRTLGTGVSRLALGAMGGIAKISAAYGIDKVYERYTERRADAFACLKTISREELYGAKNDFEKYYAQILINSLPAIFCEKGKIDSGKACEAYMALPRWQQHLLSEYYCLKHDPVHPHPLRRAKYIEEAAKKLAE